MGRVHLERRDIASARGRDAETPAQLPARGWKDIALRVKDEYSSDHVSMAAAAVAFHAFLAFVPLLVAAVSIYGLFADPENITELIDRLGSSVPEELSNLIEQQLTSVVDASAGALGVGAAIGIIAALWSASSGVSQLMEAVNIAYDEDLDERPFWKRRGIALALTVLIIAFLAVVATVIGFAVSRTGVVGVVSSIVAALVSAALLMGVLSVIYRSSPDRDEPEWRWVSTGAAVAVVGWIVASLLFTVYVSNFASYNETYGALGAVIVVLLWMYVSALVVVLGAEINAEMEHQTTHDTTRGPDRPMGSRDAEVADTVGASADADDGSDASARSGR